MSLVLWITVRVKSKGRVKGRRRVGGRIRCRDRIRLEGSGLALIKD